MDLAQHLKEDITEFRRLEKKVHRKASQSNVHELRVLTRKLSAALWVSQRVLPSSDETPKELKRLGKKLGKCRELDVLKQDLKKYHLKSAHHTLKGHGEVRSQLQQHLRPNTQKKINAHLKAVHDLVSDDQYARLHKKPDLRDFLKKWPDKFPKSKKQLHDLRIETKKMIYRMDLYEMENTHLKELQKHLGRVHDLEVLQKDVQRHVPRISKETEKLLKAAKASYRDALRLIK